MCVVKFSHYLKFVFKNVGADYTPTLSGGLTLCISFIPFIIYKFVNSIREHSYFATVDINVWSMLLRFGKFRYS